MKRITIGVVSTIAFTLILGAGSTDVFQEASAQETQEVQEVEDAQDVNVPEEAQQLLIPEDLTVKENENFELQELRVGGRLERVTVKWNNGVTEVYQNKRKNTVWSAEENELGDAQNVRQWRLGSW